MQSTEVYIQSSVLIQVLSSMPPITFTCSLSLPFALTGIHRSLVGVNRYRKSLPALTVKWEKSDPSVKTRLLPTVLIKMTSWTVSHSGTLTNQVSTIILHQSAIDINAKRRYTWSVTVWGKHLLTANCILILYKKCLLRLKDSWTIILVVCCSKIQIWMIVK